MSGRGDDGVGEEDEKMLVMMMMMKRWLDMRNAG